MLDFVMFDIDLTLNTGRNLEHWGNINKKGLLKFQHPLFKPFFKGVATK